MNLRQLTIRPFPTASRHDTYLLETEGRFFEIGKDTAKLLEYLQANGGDEESISRYAEVHKGMLSKEEIVCFLDGLEKRLESGRNSNGDQRKSFLYHKDFISATTLRKYSEVLKNLFRPWLMGAVVVVFAGLEAAYFLHYRDLLEQTPISIYLIAGLYLFMAFSSLVHEIGHAAACRHYGVPHGNIGLGLYLNLPVFYTDVTHVWKLSRQQRCVVNFGGVYFQMLLLIPLLTAAIIGGNGLLDYMILLINFNFALTLNPFFKFDGYWMMTDILGVANLRKKGNEWIKYVVNKIRGKEISVRPYILSLSPWAKCGLAIYTIVVNIFFCFYFFYVIPQFFIYFYKTFPDRFLQLMTELSYQQMPSWSNMQQIILQLLFFFLFLFMTYKILSPLIRRIRWAKA
ncbi:MAG: hypothetical protein IJB46_07980 [Prevotella sp.]|nr:hypothetical protein [Prevotella sp.]